MTVCGGGVCGWLCVFDKVVVWCVVVVGARWLCVFGTVCVGEEMVMHIGWHERRDGVCESECEGDGGQRRHNNG